MKHIEKIIWGIVLVIAAILIALNSFNLIEFDIFFDGWWTLFIIIPCFAGIFRKKDITGNIFGLFLGICLLLSAQGVISFDVFWKLLVPVIIACIGLKMIFSSFRKRNKNVSHIRMEGKGVKQSVAVFCGTNLNFTNTVFDGAKLTAWFGGIDCDLTGAIIDKDAVIKVSCGFGGINILVPDNVRVVNNTTCLFGGTEVAKSDNSAEYTLFIEGSCMFGEIDIK